MNRFVFSLLALLLSACCLWLDAAWWLSGSILLITAMPVAGWGWACKLHERQQASVLRIIIDSTWIGMLQCWLSVSLLRELGAGNIDSTPKLLFGCVAVWCLLGFWISRGSLGHRPIMEREKLGLGSILVALMFLCWWKQPDLSRPLDGHWYLDGAADPIHQYVPLEPSRNWASSTPIGWPEAGAMKLVPNGQNPDLVARERVNGRVTLAVRGPVGSYISTKGKKNVVQSSMAESETEGPVRRYLDKGVAAISIWADMQPGEYLGLDVQGDEVYLLPSADAVWALHATGTLRYTYYYQILNQVENQVWAQELLTDRRFTWNQPPGWSPLLATASVFVMPDLPGASVLFLLVIFLVAVSTLELGTLVAPRADKWAWTVPAMLMLVHALLMLEPASHNFPDSLYAASIVAVVSAVIQHNHRRFSTMALFAQALRWPGAVLAAVFALIGSKVLQRSNLRGLAMLAAGLFVGILVAGIAMATGDAEDLLFILYFETFPEHYHGNYSVLDLLKRVPAFFGKWAKYTGGMLLLAAPFALGPQRVERKNLQVVLLGALLYAFLLGTIDHDPSHYFLPLIALTGPAFIAASACLKKGHQRWLIVIGNLGVAIYLWTGVV